jgi:hypothetical protein
MERNPNALVPRVKKYFADSKRNIRRGAFWLFLLVFPALHFCGYDDVLIWFQVAQKMVGLDTLDPQRLDYFYAAVAVAPLLAFLSRSTLALKSVGYLVVNLASMCLSVLAATRGNCLRLGRC